MIRLFPVALAIIIAGCSEPEEEGSYAGGRFERCLCDVDTSLLVDLVNEKSVLIVKFFKDEYGDLAGNVYLDGEIKVLGFTLKDSGHSPYPLDGLAFENGELEGKVEIDGFPDDGFNATLEDKRQTLVVDVNHLGNGDLYRVDKPDPEPEIEDTGAPEDTP